MSIRDEQKQQSRQAFITAALHLSAQGRAFSSISLRELSREVGRVPAAFYRHFQDLDELGLELVDQVSLHLKAMLHQLGQAYIYQPNSKTKISIDLFFQAVIHHRELFIFFIRERCGGSAVLRDAIAREIDFLTEDLRNNLKRLDSMQHIQAEQDIHVLSHIVVNLALNWAMDWIAVARRIPLEKQAESYARLKTQTLTQIQLLFHGALHWQSQVHEDSSSLQPL